MTTSADGSAPGGPGLLRRILQVLLLLGGGAVVVAIGLTLAQIPGVDVFRLEVAASHAEARVVLGDATNRAVVLGMLGDVVLIAAYVLVLFLGLRFFPVRAFRVRAFRTSGRALAWLAVVAGVLDLVEDAMILVGTFHPGDLAWQVAAIAAWPKFVVLVGLVGYLLLAAATYLTTPAWLVPHLQDPPRPNVTLDAAGAARPEGRLGPGRPTTTADDRPARFGIAVSGGGVRSASLALGTLQTLDEAYPAADSGGPSWSTADKVASVSGGSYIAGGISLARSARVANPAAAARPWQVPAADRDAWRTRTDQDGTSVASPEERRLIGRLGYLLMPNPAGRPPGDKVAAQRIGSDVPGVVALVSVGACLNLAVLLGLLWLVVTPYGFLLDVDPLRCDTGWACVRRPQLLLPVVFWAAIAVLVLLVWVGSGWVRAAFRPGSGLWLVCDVPYRHLRFVLRGLLVLVGTLLVLLVLGPALVDVIPTALTSGLGGLTPAAVVAGLGAGVSLVRGLSGTGRRLAPLLGGVLFVAMLALASLEFLAAGPALAHWWYWLTAAGGSILLYAVVSGEWWSMAGFYRARLRLAFATYRRPDGTAEGYTSGSYPPATAEPSLRELASRTAAVPDGSPLQICATAHASGPEVRSHYGIPAMSVTMSPDVIRVHVPTSEEGGWEAHEASTEQVERLLYQRGGPRLTTMLGVGVSGAAVSPAMGLYRIGPARALLAAANIRLGVWLPNPRYAHLISEQERIAARAEGPTTATRYPRPRLSYLLKEMFGVHDLDDLYLYVTDGGHWENTGLVELLRDRTIDEVVCIDADEQPRQSATEIAAAVGLAKLECNVSIELRLDPLRAPAGAGRGQDYSPQSVVLGLVRRDGHVGLIWYAKPVLTAAMPPEILSYAECDASFPITTTVDQFFHTAQFVAYRDLGRFNGEQIAAARAALIAATTQVSLAVLRERAADPGTHWAVRSFASLVRDEREYQRLVELLRRSSNLSVLPASPQAAAAPVQPTLDPAVAVPAPDGAHGLPAANSSAIAAATSSARG